MNISITESGLVAVDLDEGSIALSREEATELFVWLYERRDWLAGRDGASVTLPAAIQMSQQWVTAPRMSYQLGDPED